MNLADYRSHYYELSGKASDVARTLALSGIAVIWVFAIGGHDGNYKLPHELLSPGLFIVLSLFFDLAQYVIGASTWGIFARHHEKRGVDSDAELTAPPWFNWPALACFFLKLACVAAAYIQLIWFLWGRLF